MFFPGSESRFQKKNTPVPSFITGFHRTWIVYYNTGLLVPCFGFQTIRENIDYWVPVALRVKWILIGRFSTNQRQGYEKSVARVEIESRRFSFRSRNLSQFKADFKLFKVYSAMPPKKKQTKKKKKLLILIRLRQLCLSSLTRIAQVNPFQRPRIPRPKIIPSRTRRLLKSLCRYHREQEVYQSC